MPVVSGFDVRAMGNQEAGDFIVAQSNCMKKGRRTAVIELVDVDAAS